MQSNMLRVVAPRAYFAGTAGVTPPDTSPSGQDMPTTDLAGWQLAWSNDFNIDVAVGQFANPVSGYVGTYNAGTAIGSGQFGYYPLGYKDSSKRGSYDPANYSVLDGVLQLHMYHSGAAGAAGVYHVGALLPKLTSTPGQGTVGGRYAMRYQVDAINTYKIAWLLWPDGPATNVTGSTSGTGIGGNGEIDYPEHGLYLTSTLAGHTHIQDGTRPPDTTLSATSAITPADGSRVWRTAVIEWRPNADRVSSTVKYYIDGSLLTSGSVTGSNVPNQRMHWVLQSETTTYKPDGVNYDPMDDTANGYVNLDWVAYWNMV